MDFYMYNVVGPDYFSIYFDTILHKWTKNIEKMNYKICNETEDYLLLYSYNLTNHTANSLTLRIKSDQH